MGLPPLLLWHGHPGTGPSGLSAPVKYGPHAAAIAVGASVPGPAPTAAAHRLAAGQAVHTPTAAVTVVANAMGPDDLRSWKSRKNPSSV